MIGVLLFILGLYVGFVSPVYYYRFIQRRQYKKEFLSLVPTPVREDKLCQGRHEWIEATSVTQFGSYGSVRMCDACGFIPSTNQMATKETLLRVKENAKVREMDKKIDLEFETQEQEELKRQLEEMGNEPTYERLYDVYRTGQTAYKRLALHRIVRTEDLKKEKT